MHQVDHIQHLIVQLTEETVECVHTDHTFTMGARSQREEGLKSTITLKGSAQRQLDLF